MTTPSDAAPDGPDSAPASAPKKSGWRKAKRWLLVALATPVLLFILYTVFAYNWSYSDGDRSGILRKFSRKGWLCKTWEGELAMTTVPGVMPEPWAFTIRDDSVAAKVNASIGKNVVVHYDEHRGLWSGCFGETPYFVDSVRVLE